MTLFNAPAFRDEIVTALGKESLSARGLCRLLDVPLSSVCRFIAAPDTMTVETYLRIRQWLDIPRRDL